MIRVSGSILRSFIFPANPSTAFDFYADISRTLSYLRHISVIQSNREEQFRVLYSTTELGIYHVRILCDIQARLNQDNWSLCIQPLPDTPTFAGKEHLFADKEHRNETGMYTLTGPGYFSSESIFHEEGKQTRIDYRLNLHASLPVPLGLRFVPEPVINSITRNITHWRFSEIVDAFIDRSIHAYQCR